MTSLSTRYLLPLLGLLVPALLAVWSYAYGGFRSDDCVDPSALLDTTWIEGLEGEELSRHRSHGWSYQAVGGTVATKTGRMSPLRFQILRSFEPARLYAQPAKLFFMQQTFASSQPTPEWIGAEGFALPIHEVAAEAVGGVRIGAYMFLYGAGAVESPSRALLSTALECVRSGRRPLTLVMASVLAPTPLRKVAEERIHDWLISAWEHYRNVCH